MIPEKRKLPTRTTALVASSAGTLELSAVGNITAALATVMASWVRTLGMVGGDWTLAGLMG